MILLNCPVCSHEFQVLPYRLRHGHVPCCSQKCGWIHKRGPRTSDEERFWKYVNKTESCWLWTGATVHGYGQFVRYPTSHTTSHKFSWEIHNGPVQEGLDVCHDCPGGDNRKCVNPEHLWLGTRRENMDDAVEKQAMCHGEDQPASKLTEIQVREIRKIYAGGQLSQTEIGKLFDVTQSNVGRIVRKSTWKHVP